MLTVVTPGPFGVGAWLTPETKRHLLMCYQFKFGSSATKVYAQIRREPPKLGSAADGRPILWNVNRKSRSNDIIFDDLE